MDWKSVQALADNVRRKTFLGEFFKVFVAIKVFVGLCTDKHNQGLVVIAPEMYACVVDG